MEELELIYTDIIIDNSIATYNKHKINNPDKIEYGHNVNCGDNIILEVKFKENLIYDLAFSGTGCTISQASASIMIDLLKGKTKQEASEIINIFLKMINKENIDSSEINKIGDAIAFKNIINMPARVKCAELAWKTMKSILI